MRAYCRHVREWLGRQDSNLRMAVPKTAALPLGYAPYEADHTQLMPFQASVRLR